MIEYIQGILKESTPLKTIVEVGGIGYKVFIPLSHYAKLPPLGDSLCLFISFVIREDSHKYYGFLTAHDRDLFENLIEVSGIGPKTALALIGHLDGPTLQQAISLSDISSLCRVPGIGKKTAERLIIEMRDRVQKGIPHQPSLPINTKKPILFQDALCALVNLGYPTIQAQKALQNCLDKDPEIADLGNLITLALRAI